MRYLHTFFLDKISFDKFALCKSFLSSFLQLYCLASIKLCELVLWEMIIPWLVMRAGGGTSVIHLRVSRERFVFSYNQHTTTYITTAAYNLKKTKKTFLAFTEFFGTNILKFNVTLSKRLSQKTHSKSPFET